MTDVDQLLKEYIAEHRAGGEANPRTYLERVSGIDRAELAALIDGYLVRAPGQPWSEAAYRGSPAERAVEDLQVALLEPQGWAGLLERLRHQAKIRREDLSSRLAEELGVAAKREKVHDYYHLMERNELPAEGVSDRVLDALARLLNTTRGALRLAGQRAGPQGAADAAAFARTTRLSEAAPTEGMASPGEAPRAPEPPDSEEPDEVDRLFLGG